MGRPSKVVHAAAAFTGSDLYVSGGRADNGGISAGSNVYSVVNNKWAALTTGPSARYGALGAWDSSGFVVWAGRDDANAFNDGQRYDPSATSWAAVTQGGAPAVRHAPWRESGWAARISSNTVLFLGGLDASGKPQTDGGIYGSTGDTWTSVPDWPSKEDHRFGAGVWAGGEFVLWGGLHKGTPTTTGERFRP